MKPETETKIEEIEARTRQIERDIGMLDVHIKEMKKVLDRLEKRPSSTNWPYIISSTP